MFDDGVLLNSLKNGLSFVYDGIIVVHVTLNGQIVYDSGSHIL